MKSRRHRPRRRTGQAPATLPSETLTLDIEGYIHDGRGLARHQGQAVFVAGGLAGEKVEARWVKRQSRFGEARVTQVIQAAKERVEPGCQHFGQCGGCQLQYADHSHQLSIKQSNVLDQLQRAGVPAPLNLLPPLALEPWRYRARARLAVWFDKAGQLSLGFRRQGDRMLVNIQQCPVLPESLPRLIAPLRQVMQAEDMKAVSHIELIQADITAMVVRHTRPLKPAAVEALEMLAAELRCRIWLSPDGQNLTDFVGNWVDPRLSYTLDDEAITLEFHPQDFTQVNPEINRLMVDQAMALLAPSAQEHILDLFCGIGNFTLPLARRAGRVTGVEAIDAMVERGRANATRNHIDNAQFMACDLESYSLKSLQKQSGAFDAVLLDPPRAGAQQACQQLAHTKAHRVLYVSCNPATLARDARLLTDAGFTLNSLGIIEMFPQTSHVETMVLFTRD